ncbi:MAG: hypothetical protein IBX71_11575, partial [Candidatus Desulforudis sp.]|nr:hypothetical protein [Desulforudis sp.]
EVQKGAVVEPEFVPLSPLVWQAVEAECPPEAETLEELTNDLAGRIEAAVAAGGEAEYLVRVILTGRTPLARQLRDPDELAALAGDLERRLGLLWAEIKPGAVARPLDPAALRQGPSVLAHALDLIDQAGGDDDLLEAVAPELLAGEVRPEQRRRYLRELLTGLDIILAERLLPEEER